MYIIPYLMKYNSLSLSYNDVMNLLQGVVTFKLYLNAGVVQLLTSYPQSWVITSISLSVILELNIILKLRTSTNCNNNRWACRFNDGSS